MECNGSNNPDLKNKIVFLNIYIPRYDEPASFLRWITQASGANNKTCAVHWFWLQDLSQDKSWN